MKSAKRFLSVFLLFLLLVLLSFHQLQAYYAQSQAIADTEVSVPDSTRLSVSLPLFNHFKLEAASPLPDASSIILETRQAMIMVFSYHFEEIIDIRTIQYPGTDKEKKVSLHNTGTGDLIRPARIKADIERKAVVDGSAASGSLSFVKVNGAYYSDIHDMPSLSGVFWEDVYFLDPGILVSNLLSLSEKSFFFKSLTRDGDGVPCYLLTGNYFSALMGLEPDLIPVRAEVWIDESDFFIRRILLKCDIPEIHGGGDFLLDLKLSGFNQQEPFTVPPATLPPSS